MPSLLSASQGPLPGHREIGVLISDGLGRQKRLFDGGGRGDIRVWAGPSEPPTAVRMLVTSVALLGMMVPDAIAPGKGAMRSETSRGWPLATICLVSDAIAVGHFHLVARFGLEVIDNLLRRRAHGTHGQESNFALGMRAEPTAKHQRDAETSLKEYSSCVSWVDSWR